MTEFNFQTKPLKTGLNFAHPMKQIAKLTTEGVHLFASEISKNRLDISDLSLLEKFVNRESLNLSVDTRNQTVVSYRGIPVGYGLEDQGKLKSQFPKAGWPFVFKTD
jgi:NOL1/NOP2/fmu family ribosome biogenesis protein